MKTFLKISKWLFIVFILWIILLLLSIYLSSLNSYKESDFNIPKDFFVTKFWDRDPYGEENWFEDFVKFKESFIKIDLKYFDIESKCIFDDEEEWNCKHLKDVYIKDLRNEKVKEYFFDIYKAKTDKDKVIIKRKITLIENILNHKLEYNSLDISEEDIKNYNDWIELFESRKKEIIEQKFKKFKNFVAVNKLKYRKIAKKEYILQTKEFSIFEWKVIFYSDIIQYSRAIRYLAYRYFEEWKYEQWINVLLDYQLFIDNLINKYDWDLMGASSIMTINNINNKGLEYFINNYNISKKLKNKIILVLENNIDNWFIQNSIKRDHLWYIKIFQYTYDKSINREEYTSFLNYILWYMKTKLFFSVKETKLISDKKIYDSIISKNKDIEWKCFSNISNYIWREMECYSIKNSFLFKKEQDMHNLRFQILEKLK